MRVQQVYREYRDEEKIFYRDGKETKDFAIDEVIKQCYFDENGFLAVELYSKNPDKTKPYVLFKEFGDYCITDRHNYYCQYRDANKITVMRDFENSMEAIGYLDKFCGINHDLILDMTEE